MKRAKMSFFIFMEILFFYFLHMLCLTYKQLWKIKLHILYSILYEVGYRWIFTKLSHKISKNTFFPSADTIKLLVTKLHCHKSLVICNWIFQKEVITGIQVLMGFSLLTLRWSGRLLLIDRLRSCRNKERN